ncbi:DUF47 domain-containing protein [Candidatus Magnetaquicoccus inordinatus]|uniref:DUF47 domain-containing protein n=1 Tax=Candidatus Magnetaquicoccus inordinatus TaxID=2496818 RepID=UPI00102C4FD6|nr:DUF47 family protein [Candidatus Magnetaquicoccus inordinatus]
MGEEEQLSGKARARLEVNTPHPSFWVRLMENVFPKTPDFFALLIEQCEVMSQCMDALVAFMETGDPEKGAMVRELEKQGDIVQARNFAILAKAFSTPLDREDLYRAITSIDMILNYAKTTVREVEAFQLTTTEPMVEMVKIIKRGTDALHRGYVKLSFDPLGAVDEERLVQQSEHDVETFYRQALATFLDGPVRAQQVAANTEGDMEERLLSNTLDLFRHRELYRHLSNLADEVAEAGTVLYDIMVQV